MYIKTKDVYNKDIADDVEERYGTSNCTEDDDRPLAKGINEKKIGLMKYLLGWIFTIDLLNLHQKYMYI